jgi:hypothetical protein
MNDTQQPLRLWPDNPTAVDLLGFSDIAAPVLDAITRDRLDPVAVGIFGDWGSGKTTVLEIIDASLADQAGTLVVFTRPWEYDPTLDARATLITEVLEALREQVEDDKDLWGKTKSKFADLAKRIKWSKAITLAARSAVTFTLPDPGKLIEIFGDGEQVADPTLQGFRSEFKELMDELETIDRVVVLVDDLDRCLPETVVMTLEAIKLFLSVEKMAFVIAADEMPVKLAIARHFDRDERGTEMAANYLEKIVQIPLTVPALGQGDTEAYLAMMLLDHHLDGDEAALSAIAAHCTIRRRAAEKDVFDDFDDGAIPAGASSDLALAAELAPVLSQRLDGNPRRLKRFLNAFWVRGDIAARRGVELDPRALAKLMVLERIEPYAFGQVLDWLGEGRLPEQLKAMEEGKLTEGPFGWWAELPPKLTDTDLGPYLRLAAAFRRRLDSRGGLPPELEQLLEGLTADGLPERSSAQKELAALSKTDKGTMARGIVEVIRRDPSSQDALGESLAELLKEEELVAEIADLLRRISPSRVEPALVIALGGDGELAGPMRDLLTTWNEDPDLQEMSRNAVKEVLGAD